LEPQDKVSEDNSSSEPKSSKTQVPLTSVSMSTQVKAIRVPKPVNKRGTSTSKANLVTGSLTHSRGVSQRQHKPKSFSKGSGLWFAVEAFSNNRHPFSSLFFKGIFQKFYFNTL
jgi:hypothetical protein